MLCYQLFVSALLSFILYLLVFLKMRGIVRAQLPSTSVASADREREEKYEHKLARQMLLYPVSDPVVRSVRTDADMGLSGLKYYLDPPNCLRSFLYVDRA